MYENTPVAIFTVLMGILIWCLIIYLIIRIIAAGRKKREEIQSTIHSPSDSSDRNATELAVEWAIAESLYGKGYVIFGDLIIPSVSKKIKSTQIDHVVVSTNGIFCIETKSHKGSIYGGKYKSNWKQFLYGSRSYDLHSPIRQNHHHVESLEYLLRNVLKAPVHSYVVFPNASKVVIDHRRHDMSTQAMINRIVNHTRDVYTPEEVSNIAKGLAFVASKSDDYSADHIEAVQKYLGTIRI